MIVYGTVWYDSYPEFRGGYENWGAHGGEPSIRCCFLRFRCLIYVQHWTANLGAALVPEEVYAFTHVK